MSHPEGLAIARRLIAEEAEKKTGFLDLGNLGLTELPDELFDLAHLRALNLGSFIHKNETFQTSNEAMFFGSNNLQDHAIESLRDLELESLHVAGVAISNLLATSRLTNLRVLECSNTIVNDLTPLAQLASLQSLNCNQTRVNDLAPLAQLTKLQSLNCSQTQVAELTPLARLANLQSLDCSETQVTDLSPLARLTNLQFIDCCGTKVTDLTPLAQLTNLQSLNSSYTEVTDLTPLAQLANLQWLDFSRTQVTDLTLLAQLANLQSLDCNYTQVTDLTPLIAIWTTGKNFDVGHGKEEIGVVAVSQDLPPELPSPELNDPNESESPSKERSIIAAKQKKSVGRKELGSKRQAVTTDAPILDSQRESVKRPRKSVRPGNELVESRGPSGG